MAFIQSLILHLISTDSYVRDCFAREYFGSEMPSSDALIAQIYMKTAIQECCLSQFLLRTAST